MKFCLGKSMGCWTRLKTSSWAYPTTVLSLYGFFAYCRVAEPFLTPYLIGPHKNISGEVVRMTHTHTFCYTQTCAQYSKACIHQKLFFFLKKNLIENNCSTALTNTEICIDKKQKQMFIDHQPFSLQLVSHSWTTTCSLSGLTPIWSFSSLSSSWLISWGISPSLCYRGSSSSPTMSCSALPPVCLLWHSFRSAEKLLLKKMWKLFLM